MNPFEINVGNIRRRCDFVGDSECVQKMQERAIWFCLCALNHARLALVCGKAITRRLAYDPPREDTIYMTFYFNS